MRIEATSRTSGGVGSSICIDGKAIDVCQDGINVAVFDPFTGQLDRSGAFVVPTGSRPPESDLDRESASNKFADLIDALPKEQLVVIVTQGAVNLRTLSTRAKKACELVGSALIHTLADGDRWALVGSKGTAPGNAHEDASSVGDAVVRQTRPLSRVASEGLRLSVYSEGCCEEAERQTMGFSSIEVNDVLVLASPKRGLNIVVLDVAHESIRIVSRKSFDTYPVSSTVAAGRARDGEDLLTFLEAIKDGQVVAISVCDEAAHALTGAGQGGRKDPDVVSALKRLGSEHIERLGYRHSWAFIGMKGRQDALAEESAVDSAVTCTLEMPSQRLFDIEAVSIGHDGTSHVQSPGAKILLNGKAICETSEDGILVTAFDESRPWLSEHRLFDLHGGSSQGRDLLDFLRDVPIGRIVALAGSNRFAAPWKREESFNRGGQGIHELLAQEPAVKNVLEASKLLGIDLSDVDSIQSGSWAAIARKGVRTDEPIAIRSTGLHPVVCKYSFSPESMQQEIGFRVVVSTGSTLPSMTPGVLLNGTPLWEERPKGEVLDLVVIDRDTGQVVQQHRFEFGQISTILSDAASAIDAVPTGQIVAIQFEKDIQTLAPLFLEAVGSIGSGVNLSADWHRVVSFAIVGIKGASPGTATENWSDARSGLCVKEVFPFATRRHHAPFHMLSARQLAQDAEVFANGASIAVSDVEDCAVSAALVEVDGRVAQAGVFGKADRDKLLALLDRKSSDRFIAIAGNADAALLRDSGVVDRIEKIGARRIRNLGPSLSRWSFVGKIGAAGAPDGASHSIAEVACSGSQTAADSFAWLSHRAAGVGEHVVTIESAGLDCGNSSACYLDGASVEATRSVKFGEGLNVVTFDPNGGIQTAVHYDTTGAGVAEALALAIERVPAGIVVIVTAQGRNRFTPRLVRALRSLGSAKLGLSRWPASGPLRFQGSWCLFGVKGAAPGSTFEALDDDGAVSIGVTLPMVHTLDGVKLAGDVAGGKPACFFVIPIALGIIGGLIVANLILAAHVGQKMLRRGRLADPDRVQEPPPSIHGPPPHTIGVQPIPQRIVIDPSIFNDIWRGPLTGQPVHVSPRHAIGSGQAQTGTDEDQKQRRKRRIKVLLTSGTDPFGWNLKWNQSLMDLYLTLNFYVPALYKRRHPREDIEVEFAILLSAPQEKIPLVARPFTKAAVLGLLATMAATSLAYEVQCFVYSGHGENKEENYSLAYTGKMEGEISLSELTTVLAPVRLTGKWFTVLDCCHSGGMIDRLPGIGLAGTETGQEIALIFERGNRTIDFVASIRNAMRKFLFPTLEHIVSQSEKDYTVMKPDREEREQAFEKNLRKAEKELAALRAQRDLLYKEKFDDFLRDMKGVFELNGGRLQDLDLLPPNDEIATRMRECLAKIKKKLEEIARLKKHNFPVASRGSYAPQSSGQSVFLD